jgi:hypothetical protein
MKTNLQTLIEVREALKAQPERTMNEYKVLGKLETCIALLEADAAAAAPAPAPVHTS